MFFLCFTIAGGKIMLSLNNLTKKYEEKVVVNDISLNVNEGDILGFLGPNGAGKTTTIKMACGLIKPSAGSITAYNHSLNKNYKQYITQIGAVLEGSRNIYWKLTPVENMEYYAGIRGIRKKDIVKSIEYYLDIFNLKDKRNVECSKLSRGMQQKVSICCSLIHNPKILFLDEPTLGLDVESVILMENVLKDIVANNRIIFLTSHDLKFASNLCNKIIIINHGSIVLNENINFLKQYSRKIVYSVQVDHINHEEIGELNDMFKITTIIDSNNMLNIEVELNTDEQIIDLLNKLRYINVKVLGVHKIERELEDIFVDVIKQKGGTSANV